MADNIRLITYAEQTVTPMNDAILQDIGVGQSGILYGVDIIASGNVLSLTGGYGVIKGRLFQVNASDITVQLASSSTINGRLHVRLDLSNQSEPISIIAQTGDSISTLTQEEDANYTNGVYEMELATFTVSTAEVSNVQRVARILHGGVKVITETEWSLDDVTDDGWYYFDHLHFPADHPSTLVNGWLRVLNGGNAVKQIIWRQGSETTQADTFVRTFTNGAWTSLRRLVSENEMYYMPGDQVTLYGYGGGYMTSGKTMITFMLPTPKPFHSSVRGATYVETNDTITIRQNNGYVLDSEPLKRLTLVFGIRPNGLQLNISRTSGFSGTNNDGLGIAVKITVRLT